MIFAAGFTWFHLLPGIEDDTAFAWAGVEKQSYLIPLSWTAALLLILFAIVGRRALMKAWSRPGLEKYFPDERLTLRNATELFGVGVYSQVKDILGQRDGRTFFPLLGAIFIYILVSNLLVLVPGFLPPTEYISNNIGLAAIVFVTFVGVGLIRDPKYFLSHMWGPIFLLGPLIFLIEAFSMIVRPVVLTLRLTGNMFGDTALFIIMSDLVPWVVPSIFLALAILVSFVQAYVFALLSTIYVALSVPHDDH